MIYGYPPLTFKSESAPEPNIMIILVENAVGQGTYVSNSSYIKECFRMLE